MNDSNKFFLLLEEASYYYSHCYPTFIRGFNNESSLKFYLIEHLAKLNDREFYRIVFSTNEKIEIKLLSFIIRNKKVTYGVNIHSSLSKRMLKYALNIRLCIK